MQKTTITTLLLGLEKIESNLYLQKDGLMARRANLHQRLDEPTQNPTQIGGICAYKWFVFSHTFVFLKVNTPQKHPFSAQICKLQRDDSYNPFNFNTLRFCNFAILQFVYEDGI